MSTKYYAVQSSIASTQTSLVFRTPPGLIPPSEFPKERSALFAAVDQMPAVKRYRNILGELESTRTRLKEERDRVAQMRQAADRAFDTGGEDCDGIALDIASTERDVEIYQTAEAGLLAKAIAGYIAAKKEFEAKRDETKRKLHDEANAGYDALHTAIMPQLERLVDRLVVARNARQAVMAISWTAEAAIGQRPAPMEEAAPAVEQQVLAAAAADQA